MYYKLIKRTIDKNKDNDYYFALIEGIFSENNQVKKLGRSEIHTTTCHYYSQDYHLNKYHAGIVIFRKINNPDEIQISMLLLGEKCEEKGEKLASSIEDKL